MSCLRIQAVHGENNTRLMMMNFWSFGYPFGYPFGRAVEVGSVKV